MKCTDDKVIFINLLLLLVVAVSLLCRFAAPPFRSPTINLNENWNSNSISFVPPPPSNQIVVVVVVEVVVVVVVVVEVVLLLRHQIK